MFSQGERDGAYGLDPRMGARKASACLMSGVIIGGAMDSRGGVEHDWTKQYRLVAGVYAMRDGHILMLERASGMMIGFWSVPGGHVDPGETPQEAAVRETQLLPLEVGVCLGTARSG